MAAGAVLAIAAPAVAQQLPPAEIADVAMRACIRTDPDASAGVQADGFSVRSRIGQTYVYEHEGGATMTLTSRPGFFNCEMEIPGAGPGYLDTLLSELEPEIDRRLDIAGAHRAESGALWQTTTESDVVVSIDVSEGDGRVVSITSSADAAPLTLPTE